MPENVRAVSILEYPWGYILHLLSCLAYFIGLFRVGSYLSNKSIIVTGGKPRTINAGETYQ